MGINRGTVLDLINDVHRAGGFKDYNSYSYLFNQVDTMPESKEDAEPHWIPVTERLPKPRESVIISVNGKYGDWIGEGCYWETTENHVIWKGYRWNATYWDDEIIAWMPLPEPYKGVTE